MTETLGSVQHISQVIGQVVAPSFMLGAVASFISMLFNRMDVVINRVRQLNALPDSNPFTESMKQDIPRLQWRIKVMHRTILLAIGSGITTTLLIITTFAVAVLGYEHVWGTAGLFVIAMGFFCASLVTLMVEVFRSVTEVDQH